MNSALHSKLKILLLPLAVGVVIMQTLLDPRVAELHEGEQTTFAGLSTEFILGPMLGLQQAVAGLLWVRADEFFHEGDYDAILPIVRMVTWLDPHQLDVYITGGWHLAYNFTDTNERSDRRYIPAAQALLKEGARNNNKVYDIHFELGWQNYDKIKNYAAAEYWYRQAWERKAITDRSLPPSDPPAFVLHQLAHAQERGGKIDESLETWRLALKRMEAKLKEDPKSWLYDTTRDSETHNLELTLKRKFSRFVHEIDFDKDQTMTRSVNPVTGEPSPKDSWVFTEGPKLGQPKPPALTPPWDVAFQTSVAFPEPYIMDPKGKINIADGARVTIRLHDENFEEKSTAQFEFDVNQEQTIMLDQHSVRGGGFGRRIDMSKDPKMYVFSEKSKAFYIVFEFDPRATSPYIQDRIGWLGDGMTDKKFMTTYDVQSPQARILRKVYKVSKDQIEGTRAITEADVVSNEEYSRVAIKAIPSVIMAPKP